MLLQGLLDLEAGNANLAADELGVLANRQPANQRVQLLLARALYEAGDYNQLFSRFASLAQRSGASPYLLTLLGRAFEDQGNRAAAAKFLDRAANASRSDLQPIFEPDSPSTLAPRFAADPLASGQAALYVRSLLNAQNQTAAAQAANQFLQLRPGSGDALALLGDVELISGRAGDALAHYQRAAQVRFPDLLLLRVCEAYDRLGQIRAAEIVVGEYLAAFPNSRLAARMMGGQAELGGDWRTAVLLLANLRTRGWNRDVRLLTDLSLVQLRSGDTPAALASAQRAWELQPSNPSAAKALGSALAAAGQNSAGAGQLFEQARRMNLDNPSLLAALAPPH
jgi:Flp pilus assembly protein TadD